LLIVLILKGINDQPTACGRMGRALWNRILFAGNLIPEFRETHPATVQAARHQRVVVDEQKLEAGAGRAICC